MFTIKSVAPGGLLLNHYGTFANFTDATRAATNVRATTRQHGLLNTYTVVPVPDGVTPMPLHPSYLV